MIRTVGLRRMLPAVAVASSIALLASGCGSNAKTEGGGGNNSAEGRVLNVWAGTTTPVVENFNPFALEPLHATNGPIFEPLFYFNAISDSEPTALLGESYEWNEDGTSLTIKVREGVKWNDGTPFTAEDVAFTYTYDIAKPSYVDTAVAEDDTTLTVTFNAPSFTNEASLLSTMIIPKHIWEGIADPITEINSNPVGTGPYKVEEVTDAAYTIVANEDYWDEGKPGIKTVRYLGLNANQTARDMLTTGKLDWAGMFAPDPENVTKDGTLGVLNTPVNPTVLYTCSNAELGCEGPQTDVAVRQAINVAIDRGQLNEKAWAGQATAISPTFALLGRDDKWIAEGMPSESPQTSNAEEAGAILEAAGYAKGSDGVYAKDGKKLELTLTSVADWTDYNDAAKLISEEAAKAGITINAMTTTQDEMNDGRFSGNFQLMVGGITGSTTADPYTVYKDWFSGPSTTPVGTNLETGSGQWNVARYQNADVDAAILAAAATNDEDAKKAAYATVQENIVRDVPYIPVVVNATQTFFNVKDFTGWPTDDNLYAFPPSWGPRGAAGVVLASLKPAN